MIDERAANREEWITNELLSEMNWMEYETD